MTISLAIIYQELLGTYGDRGNALTISHRAKQHNISCEIIQVKPGEKIPTSCDIYLLGGGEDNAQTLATTLLMENKKDFIRAIENSQLLAICAGFQILGKHFPVSKNKFSPGLDLIDVSTQPGSPRIIGEVVSKSVIPGVGDLTGFENHAGRTLISNNSTPLGNVIKGLGNGIETNGTFVDGYFSGGIVCSYMHGPILARNPRLCDYILSKATNLDFLAMAENDDTARMLHQERLLANK